MLRLDFNGGLIVLGEIILGVVHYTVIVIWDPKILYILRVYLLKCSLPLREDVLSMHSDIFVPIWSRHFMIKPNGMAQFMNNCRKGKALQYPKCQQLLSSNSSNRGATITAQVIR